MATPFNSVAELVQRTALSQGESGTPESVLDATFTFSQFQNSLQDARDFIFSRTNETANEDFTARRLSEVKQSERYLALSLLYEMYGEEVPLKSPDANLASVSQVAIGAD